jgi:hypothetical protein
MSAAWPRLMPQPMARRYMGGLDPLLEFGATPRFHRGQPYFDKAELDRILDAGRESAPPMGDDPDAALSAWLTSDGPAERRS